MKLKKISTVKTKGEARQIAIDWQNWQSTQSLSYMEIAQALQYFFALAKKFNLAEEFTENGII